MTTLSWRLAAYYDDLHYWQQRCCFQRQQKHAAAAIRGHSATCAGLRRTQLPQHAHLRTTGADGAAAVIDCLAPNHSTATTTASAATWPPRQMLQLAKNKAVVD